MRSSILFGIVLRVMNFKRSFNRFHALFPTTNGYLHWTIGNMNSTYMSMLKTIVEYDISTIFNINDSVPKYGVYKTEEIAFGMGISHLLGAINMIELGDFPWIDIGNEVILKNQDKQEV
jgi:hypothetical protein